MAKSRFVDLDPKDDQKQYAQGFNSGYLIAQVVPSLSEQLVNIKSDHPGIRGMRDGSKLFQLEMVRDTHVDKKTLEAEKNTLNYVDDWLKCYNQGYSIAEKLPELVSVIMTAEGANRTKEMSALKTGIKNCLQDKIRGIHPSFLKASKDDRPLNDPDKPRDKGKDLDMDR